MPGISSKPNKHSRREIMQLLGRAAAAGFVGPALLAAAPRNLMASNTRELATSAAATDATQRGLQWLCRQQSRLGNWSHDSYSVALTALAATALLCTGSTTTQGPYAAPLRRAIDFLLSRRTPTGLIGDPKRDNRYTYGHGFSMLCLSQVLGEEEDQHRRDELIDTLTSAVQFSVAAQTKSGGWGYVSAAEGNDFDEGSTTITQVQGLRGCRNAGIAVPRDTIDAARNYIYNCLNADGGVSYSSRTRGSSRPAITAAALAALFNAGDFSSPHLPAMWKYCQQTLHQIGDGNHYGHWHYTYLYYSQVVYRQDQATWQEFRDRLYRSIVQQQAADGSWTGQIAPSYASACNLIILQLDKGFLPIFQR